MEEKIKEIMKKYGLGYADAKRFLQEIKEDNEQEQHQDMIDMMYM